MVVAQAPISGQTANRQQLKLIVYASLIHWAICGVGLFAAVIAILGLFIVGVLVVPAVVIMGAVVSYKFLSTHYVPNAKQIVAGSASLAVIASVLLMNSSNSTITRTVAPFTIVVFIFSYLIGHVLFNVLRLKMVTGFIIFAVLIGLCFPLRTMVHHLAASRLETKDKDARDSSLSQLAQEIELYKPTYIPAGYQYYGYDVGNYQFKNADKSLSFIYYPDGNTQKSMFAISERKAPAELTADNYCQVNYKSDEKWNLNRCVKLGTTAKGDPIYVVYFAENGKVRTDYIEHVNIKINNTHIYFDPPFHTDASTNRLATSWTPEEIIQVVNSLQKVNTADLKNDAYKIPVQTH